VAERIQVNLPRSLRKIFRQLQYLYRNRFPDFPKDGDKKETKNRVASARSGKRLWDRGRVEGLRERNREKAKESMGKKRKGWRKERDVNGLRWRY